MYVKPVSGRQIPDPDKGGFLPAEGGEVESNQYWLRRIADGDVTQISQPVAAAPKGRGGNKEEGQ